MKSLVGYNSTHTNVGHTFAKIMTILTISCYFIMDISVRTVRQWWNWIICSFYNKTTCKLFNVLGSHQVMFLHTVRFLSEIYCTIKGNLIWNHMKTYLGGGGILLNESLYCTNEEKWIKKVRERRRFSIAG